MFAGAVGVVLAVALLLTVLQYPRPSTELNVTIGPPMTNATYFVHDGASLGFTGYQSFVVSIRSGTRTNATLSLSGLPPSSFASFSKGSLQDVGPEGKSVNLTMWGAMVPLLPENRPYYNVTILAVGEDGSSSNVTLGVTLEFPLAVIKEPAPLGMVWGGAVSGNDNGHYWGTTGAVFDPFDSASGPLAVKFSALGIYNGTRIDPIPDWINFTWGSPTLVLMPFQPQWFQTEVDIGNAPYGVYVFAIRQTINGASFIQNMTVGVYR